jgi:uncharacterized GH25 family protein
MEKFLEILRMALRKVYVALGVTAMPYLIHAAYGIRQPDPGSFTIPFQGRVVSEETGEPIAGISVGNSYIYTDTDNDGRFLVYMTTEQNSYSIYFTDVDGFENNGYFTEKQITISRDEIGDSLEINMYRESNFAVIRGTVLSKETGEPASGIRVGVGSRTDNSGVGFSAFGGFMVISDDSGQFYIHVPERNTYFMYFMDMNGLFREKSINITSDEIKNSLTVDLERINSR